MKKILIVMRNIFLTITVLITLFLAGLFLTNHDNIGLAMEALFLVKNSYYEKVDNKILIEGAISGMIDSLGDQYSSYLSPESLTDVKEHLQGSFGGVGIYVGIRDEEITIISPIENTPAERAGLKAGDVITSIENKSTKNMSLDEAVSLMKGEPGLSVVLTVRRAKQEEDLSFELVREIINVPTVRSEILEQAPGVAYLRIAMFASNTYEALTTELKKLADAGFSALIIDLRDNPGGDVNSVISIAELFVPEGPIMHIVERNGKEETIKADAKYLELPIAVLINEGTASASEILAGAIQDREVGTIIGTTSFGKAKVQTVYTLKDGAGIKITTAKYLTPNRRDLNDKGIEPDILIELPEIEDEEQDFVDIQLDKAIEILLRELGN
jgi:carboxyl-terminal processing protease